jgi:2-amino-4-hydroxy-6-hydroxymethyldihydropteridine diphosphokinase
VIDAFIGLGSNLGKREQALASAVEMLAREAGCELVALSSLYETQPVGGPPQGAYLNAAVWIRTALAPRELLQRLLAIERAHGRVRGPLRNAPRTLDLDLLFCADVIVAEPELRVPHLRLCERGFALEPLAEIAGERVHPERGETLASLAARVRDSAAVRRIDSARWSRLRAQRSAAQPAR